MVGTITLALSLILMSTLILTEKRRKTLDIVQIQMIKLNTLMNW